MLQLGRGQPLDGTKLKRVRYHRLMTSAKVVTRVAVGAGRISELQGANATKYWNFAGSTGKITLNLEKGRKLGKEALAVSGSSGEILGTQKWGTNREGRPELGRIVVGFERELGCGRTLS